jgi:uncharacterized protein
MKLAHQDGRPWYREPWPWILMSGPVIVIVAGVITAWLAVVSNDGLVADDYYKQGLAVNQQLARDHRASELEVQAELLWAGKQVRVMLTGKQLAEVTGLRLRIVHPTRSGEDQLVVLKREGAGMFGGALRDLPEPGRWNILLEDEAGTWRLQGVWQSGSDAPLRLQSASLQSPAKP